MGDALINRRTPEELRQARDQLTQWLAESGEASPEGMCAFFTRRLEGYEAHQLGLWGEEYAYFGTLIPDHIHLLDLGCGTGLELGEIWKHAPDVRVTAVDLNPVMLQQLRATYPERYVETVCGDYASVELGSGYDGAVSFETMHHLRYARKAEIYGRLARALKPGGFYLECDYLAPDQEYEDICLQWRAKLGEAADGEAYIHFDTPLTEAHQRQLFAGAGFAPELLWLRENTAIWRCVKN